MPSFPSAREAKEYLIQPILREARDENIPLSEIEQKMLYFSENYWTLPDMIEVSKEFDQRHSQDEFETKIGKLIGNLKSRQSLDGETTWNEAVSVLRPEDHYLLVLLDTPATGRDKKRPRGDYLKLFATGILVITAMFVTMWIFDKFK